MHNDIFRYIRTKQEADTVLAALHSISQDIFVGKPTGKVAQVSRVSQVSSHSAEGHSAELSRSPSRDKQGEPPLGVIASTFDKLSTKQSPTKEPAVAAEIEAVLQKYLSVEVCQVLIDQLLEEKTVSAKRQKLLEIIKKLDIDIRGFSAFTVTVAIIPTQKMVEHIYQAVESFLGSSVVLDIRYDPDMCAGAKIVWKGLYRDYSVATKIDKLFEKKREEITSLVK